MWFPVTTTSDAFSDHKNISSVGGWQGVTFGERPNIHVSVASAAIALSNDCQPAASICESCHVPRRCRAPSSPPVRERSVAEPSSLGRLPRGSLVVFIAVLGSQVVPNGIGTAVALTERHSEVQLPQRLLWGDGADFSSGAADFWWGFGAGGRALSQIAFFLMRFAQTAILRFPARLLPPHACGRCDLS